MRLTVLLFAKSGAMKAYNSVPIEDIEEINFEVGQLIKDYYNKSIWGGDLDEVTQKDEFGWTKSRLNKKTGERSFVIFYRGK